MAYMCKTWEESYGAIRPLNKHIYMYLWGWEMKLNDKPFGVGIVEENGSVKVLIPRNEKIKEEVSSAIGLAKENGQIGKHGLTGNSGLGIGGMFHISMPYDSNGKVFVNSELKDENGDVWDGWKRVDAKDADPKKVIKCYCCDKPAVRLDHLHPYHDEMTSCEDHLDEFKNYLNKYEFSPKKNS